MRDSGIKAALRLFSWLLQLITLLTHFFFPCTFYLRQIFLFFLRVALKNNYSHKSALANISTTLLCHTEEDSHSWTQCAHKEVVAFANDICLKIPLTIINIYIQRVVNQISVNLIKSRNKGEDQSNNTKKIHSNKWDWNISTTMHLLICVMCSKQRNEPKCTTPPVICFFLMKSDLQQL